jgi:hypothetical protein
VKLDFNKPTKVRVDAGFDGGPGDGVMMSFAEFQELIDAVAEAKQIVEEK